MKRYIIKFKDQNKLDVRTLSNHRSSVLSACVHKHICEGQHFDVVEMDEAHVHALGCEDCIEHIEEDTICESDAQQHDYGLSYSGATAFKQKHGLSGKGANVAVIDSGLHYSHPDLAKANIIPYKFSDGGAFQSNQLKDITDVGGHGTVVTAAIAMQNNTLGYLGVAPDATIHAIKATIGNTTTIYSSAIAGVLNYLVDKGIKVDFINISYTQHSISTVVRDACNRAYNAGMVVVAAAGNGGGVYPDSGDVAWTPNKRERVNHWKDYPNVVVVGGVQSENIRQAPKRANYSAMGKGLSITAPTNIKVADNEGGYTTTGGTSIASPFVVGALALLKEQSIKDGSNRPNSLLAQDLLFAHTTKIGSEEYFGKSGVLNLGRLAKINSVWSEEAYSLGIDKGLIEISLFEPEQFDFNFSQTALEPRVRVRVYADGAWGGIGRLSVQAFNATLVEGAYIKDWTYEFGSTDRPTPENYKTYGTLAGEFVVDSLDYFNLKLLVKASPNGTRQSRIYIETTVIK